MEMPAAFVIAVKGVDYEFNSARPNAPVVPHVEKPQRTRTVRDALTKGLTRATQALKPARPGI
nr:hypothetical protein [Micromonospora sp. DSM 115978]